MLVSGAKQKTVLRRLIALHRLTSKNRKSPEKVSFMKSSIGEKILSIISS